MLSIHDDWLSVSNPQHICSFIQHSEWVLILILLSVFSISNEGLFILLSDYVTIVWFFDLAFFALAWIGYFQPILRYFILRWFYLFVHGSSWVVFTLATAVLLYNCVIDSSTEVEMSWHLAFHMVLHSFPLLAIYIYLEPRHMALQRALSIPPWKCPKILWFFLQTLGPLLGLAAYRIFANPVIKNKSSMPEWLGWIIAFTVCLVVNGTRSYFALWFEPPDSKKTDVIHDPNTLYV